VVVRWFGFPGCRIDEGFIKKPQKANSMNLTIFEHSIPFPARAGEEIFAIGDIYGRSELLTALFGVVAATERVPGLQRIVVLLGDLIDHGPDSLGCLDLAIESKDRTGADIVDALAGNHEQMLFATIVMDGQIHRRKTAYGNWLKNGGMKVVNDLLDEGHSAKTLSDLRDALGPRQVPFLEGPSKHRTSGEFMFVHAGLNPYADLDQFLAEPIDIDFRELEGRDHWAWVRNPFLASNPTEHGKRGHHGFFVVHGHTAPNYEWFHVAEQLCIDRLNLDAGSYATGCARMARIIGQKATVRSGIRRVMIRQRAAAGKSAEKNRSSGINRVEIQEFRKGGASRPYSLVHLDSRTGGRDS
jgi:serine/threonine protein phosphatase 1